ncbi:unnamed protein product [Periconia digitata]|uniref:Kinesin light chain n=1 Tax=Periconia digitata TaxID=1303443 RepID=A0A9W4XX34_9PLEO|nr:unnamed protein product [Periconia digitata]
MIIVDSADNTRVFADGTSVNAGSARLQDYLPHSDKGKILFTTRSRKVAEELTPSHVLELDDMSKTEARQLLAGRISKPALLGDGEAVDQLLESLEYLPLAVVQAAAFINSNNVLVSEYLSLFRTAGTETELFGEHFEDSSRYRELESTIARTWHISFDQIRKQDPLAAEYLSFIACIDRISIPRSLLPPGSSVLQQTKALGTLKGYAFVTERQQASQEPGSEKCFDMHRLVHMASAWWLEGRGERSAWTARAAARLKELVPHGGHEKKEVWTRYLAHAIHVTRSDSVLEETAKASLLNRIGRCQTSLGQYSAAETAHRQALSLRERKLGNEHADTLMSISNLALMLDRQGKYKEAESMNRETLARYEKVLGPEHPDTLASMNNLAVVLKSQGKYKEAETMHRETLARKEKVLGLNHPDTLMSMNNLAVVLKSQGKYEEAELMNRETLARKEKVLGPEHPSTLMSMSNLAVVLKSQGKYEDAESTHRETLVQREKMLGREHPDTLASMGNLAQVLESQGKYEEAELMDRETLARHEKVLGREHPSTLMNMSNLATVLERQGKYEEAELMHRETLARYKKVLGQEHPDTLMSMSNLAVVLKSQGKYKEAESMDREALAQREKVLGREHPDTLTSVYNLAHLLANQHHFTESRALYERACAAYAIVIGEDHPTTRTCREHYREMLALQKQDRSTLSSAVPPTDIVNIPNKKRSKLSRGLAKMGIKSSKCSL